MMIRDAPSEQIAAISKALQLGINYFDTAPIYGATRSEVNLGRALRALDAKPLVGTKIALEIDQLDDIPLSVAASVEASLNRLGLDAVDIVYLHNRVGKQRAAKPDLGVGALLSVEDVMGPSGVLIGLERLRERKLVRYFGCCSYGGEMDALASIVDSERFDAMLVHYNLINQTAWQPTVIGSTIYDYHQIAARAAGRGMGMVILRVLEAGLLADNARPASSPNLAIDQKRVPALDFLRQETGTLTSAAIRFALSNPDVSTVLIGVSEITHVGEAVEAATQGPLSVSQLARIEAVRAADYATSVRSC